ncbi:MAG: hypothetical protein JNK85_28240 [Verrucomicrobiales bacterium]|nr:hypothetical protein [Verrucomicrobiales bacterium]
MQNDKAIRKRGPSVWESVLLGMAALAVAPASPGQVFVEALVTSLGSSIRYDITVDNQALEDLAIVSIIDAPSADPLIDDTLAVPSGFLGSYDGGLGFVDFIGDTEVFGAGIQTGGFHFESLVFPGAFFRKFEALGVFGTLYSGSIRISPESVIVPESGTTIAAAAMGGLILVHAVRRARARCQS